MRVRAAADAIISICRQYKDDHELFVYIEAMPLRARQVNGKAYTRTEMFGVIKYLLHKEQIPITTVTTTTLKKQFANHGAAEKHHIQAAVYNRYNRIVKNDNVADAIGLASIGNRHIQGELDFPHIKVG